MNPGLVVKLRPSGPWRIGPDSGARNRVDVIFHSDSLYSAVTAAMARLGWLEEWLDATVRTGGPAVSFSSCFPYLDDIVFVVPPRTVWPPASPSTKAVRVRWKSARFVPLTVVQSVLAGLRLDENQWSVDGPSDCLVPAGSPGPFRTAVRTNAGVDRLTGASERHSTACIEFRAGSGLWTVVSFEDQSAQERWSGKVKAAFRLLADTGLGGERSRGWGRSEAPEFTDGMLPDLILPVLIGSVAAAEPVEGAEAAVKAVTPVAPLVVETAEEPTAPAVEAPAVEVKAAEPEAPPGAATPAVSDVPDAEVKEVAGSRAPAMETAPAAEPEAPAVAAAPAAEFEVTAAEVGAVADSGAPVGETPPVAGPEAPADAATPAESGVTPAEMATVADSTAPAGETSPVAEPEAFADAATPSESGVTAAEVAAAADSGAPAGETPPVAEPEAPADAATPAESDVTAAEMAAVADSGAPAGEPSPVAEPEASADAATPAESGVTTAEMAAAADSGAPAGETPPAAEPEAPADAATPAESGVTAAEVAGPEAPAVETAPAPEVPAVEAAAVEPEAPKLLEAPATEPETPTMETAPVAESEAERQAPAVDVAPAVVAATPTHPHWLLSLYTPAPADSVDWRRGNYAVLPRGGRIDSPAASGDLKKQIQMVAEGSVLYAETAPRGSAANVAPDGFAHPVFRAGFAVAIPLPEVK